MNSRRFSRHRISIGLDENVCTSSATWLNQILADITVLRDLYKKCQWQVAGEMFYPLHLLFGKHYAEQVDLVDAVAGRIQLLGGMSIASAADVAEMTSIPEAQQAWNPCRTS
jgi:starvation-inducible DNA-binding protein